MSIDPPATFSFPASAARPAMESKDEPGTVQNLKGKANEVVGDLTNDPQRKEKGMLQEQAARGKEAQTRLQDDER